MEQAYQSGISGAQLRSFIERIEKLEQDKAELAETLREVFNEAKSEGFDVKVMRQLIRIRKMKKSELMLHDHLLELYRNLLDKE